ncbi:ThuA domain-containing protein [Thalassobellus suaedae]|uniref:ThuA domain-containing protein n=1 Tax=Thalassobellus suaedae TaxID=3074124 RepID=A0ABY9XS09_9FLAO|nr:ThuA domain-containing protein [Flavobacteriaceae bacterium HL-DH14]
MKLSLILWVALLSSFCYATESVLVFTKTEGFRHKSIESGVQTINLLGVENDFEVTHTENAKVFTKDNLKQYGLVIFLNTTGDVLNEDQQKAFENYIKSGGSFMGIHAASDTEFEWYLVWQTCRCIFFKSS